MLREGGTDAVPTPREGRGRLGLRPRHLSAAPGDREGAATSTQNGGYETRAARLPARHMAAPPQTSQARPRPGAQIPASSGPPLTHRPVAQDGDLPGLGLRHLGGLLSPGPTTLTAAAAPPAQTIGCGCAGGTRHTERGGGRGCLSLARSLARSTARNRTRGPSPNNTPT